MNPITGLGDAPVILLHTGLGTRHDRHLETFLSTVMEEGKRHLLAGEPALSVSWTLVGLLEESGFYNAGRGAIPQEDGVVRRDIGTMDGKTIRYLGIPGITTLSCPTRMLGSLFGKTRHALLSGEAVSRWLVANRQADLVGPPDFGASALQTWADNNDMDNHGTVGAVVRDLSGHLAATTSTGGAGRMRAGRIGDSAIPGAGTYADDQLGAVSMTGLGESILRCVAGYRLLQAVHQAKSRQEASQSIRNILDDVEQRTEGEIGGILISGKHGPFIFHHAGVLLAAAWQAGGRGFRIADIWDPEMIPCPSVRI